MGETLEVRPKGAAHEVNDQRQERGEENKATTPPVALGEQLHAGTNASA